MLNSLLIKNVALIDNAEINFTDGLNVLSGETGAGKSVILESINFVLGAKADKSLIRSGENECFVKAEFLLSEKDFSVRKILSDLDCDIEDNLLIISRKFSIDGKNSVKLNGNTMTVSMLKQVTPFLVDVHGQSEHFYLLKNSNQLELIDKFCGEDKLKVLSKIKEFSSPYNEILENLKKIGGSEYERLNRLDVLNFQIDEIETADFKDGEDELLEINKQKVINAEKISTAFNSVKEIMSGDGGISDLISNAEKCANSVSNLSEDYSKLIDKLNDFDAFASEISDDCEGFLSDLEDFDLNPEDIESRLDLIKKIKRKYGSSYSEVQDFLVKAKEERELLLNSNERAKELLEDKEKLEKQIYSEYVNLSKVRKIKAKDFTEKVIAELKTLGIGKGDFAVNFKDIPNIEDCKFTDYYFNNGIDEVEFMFSANLGEPLKPLSEVISGGEISRFMLAIKSETAKYNEISTFIFDEIDAGLSGVIAKTVAEKFANISLSTQIIAISHLPQISAMADNNLLIEKTESDGKTHTNVFALDNNGKVKEIIRLIGGEITSDSAKNHAEDLIKNASGYKNSIK